MDNRLFTDREQQIMRFYNSATGRFDLSEEEARKKEARDRAESEAADRQRQERLERWRNTPLDPEAKEALGSVPPQVAWSLIHTLVFQAFEYSPDEAQKLWDQYQPSFHDQMGLDLALQNLNPVVGINNFQYLNEKVNLKEVMKAKPLDVLEEVLKMVTISDKWQTEVLI
jgi:hypothetical protein